MTNQKFGFRMAALAALCAVICFAGATKTWIQSEAADFEKARLRHLSLRSDGRLTLAPKSTELFDASAAYLWALAMDSHGTLYTGGGPGAKLYSVTAAGAHKKIAEFDALEVHAIAIDGADAVYVATSPDGKVYRMGADGKAVEFYDPKQKYIWAMAFSPAGDLFIATGDRGEVHRVGRNGKGSVFFTTGETHARSLAFDRTGNLIVGTDPGGLVMRVDAQGKGFVLYQMSKREVTAVAVAKDGSIYAAGAGMGTSGATPPSVPPAAATPALAVPLAPTPATPVAPAQTAGAGADVYRIHPDGLPEKIWTGAKDTVYAIAFDAEGRAILASGNKGVLYRIDSAVLSTSLVTLESGQITALLGGPAGALYAVTGNVGKLYRIGPGREMQGTAESDIFDAGQFSQWGRIKWDGEAHGGKIALAARTGNLDRADNSNWSEWLTGEKPQLPAARFVQWRATLSADAGGESPDLDAVEVAYLPRNVAPRVEDVDITPANYKFAAPVVLPFAVSTPATINLPPIGKRQTAAPAGTALDLTGGSMQFAKGWLGARWNASDENGDTLFYNVEIRASNQKDWKPLAEKVREKHMSFDSTAFADGEYRLRITASDAPSNVREEALSASEISAPFLIDNTPPVITGLRVSGLRLTWHAADALSLIARAEYAVDGGEWTMVDPVGRLSDSRELDYALAVAPGHSVAVRVTDEYGNTAVASVR